MRFFSRVSLRRRRPYYKPTMTVLATPGTTDAGDIIAAYTESITVVGPRKMISEMESPSGLIDATRLALIALNNLRVFPQISGDDTKKLNATEFADQVESVCLAYNPQFINLKVEYNNNIDWYDMNIGAVRAGMAAGRAVCNAMFGISFAYEQELRPSGQLELRVEQAIRDFDCLMLTTYPQLEIIDPADGTLTDTRVGVDARYYDPVMRLAGGKIPVVFAEAGWHTRTATGEADQLHWMEQLQILSLTGQVALINHYFMRDANAYWPIAYFADMGMYTANGTAKPAAAVFAEMAANV